MAVTDTVVPARFDSVTQYRRTTVIGRTELIMKLFTLGTGIAIGYLIGSKRGRAEFERTLSTVRKNAAEKWKDPKVQEQVSKAEDTAKKYASEAAGSVKKRAEDAKGPVADATVGAASRVEEAAKTSGSSSTGSSSRSSTGSTSSSARSNSNNGSSSSS